MPMVMSSEQHKWFIRMRGEWWRVMKPFSGLGVRQLFPPVALPPPERFDGCILLPDRASPSRATQSEDDADMESE
jgi:hypothetical protein